MSDRRKFLQLLGLTAGAFAAPSVFDPLFARGEKKLARVNALTPEVAASDDDFWNWVREQ